MSYSTEINSSKGLLICLLAYFFVSLIGLCEKSLSSTIPISVILFFQNGICVLLILPSLWRLGIKPLTKHYLGTYFIRILSGLGCYGTLFYIIRYMPISEALLYQYSGSLWIPLISLAWLNVRMPKNLWYGIVVGFIGILLILKPTQNMLGFISICGILCGIFQGVSVVAIRKLSVVEPLARVLFCYFFISTLASSVNALPNWPTLDSRDFILLLGVGVCTYIGQKLITVSLHYADATTLAPICYISIVFSGLIGWLFWQEIPDKTTLIGMSLVISGCFFAILANQYNLKIQRIALEIENG